MRYVLFSLQQSCIAVSSFCYPSTGGLSQLSIQLRHTFNTITSRPRTNQGCLWDPLGMGGQQTMSQISVKYKQYYWMRVSKILCFFQWQADKFWRFQQIIGLRDKSPYFAITDFNDITALSFDHQVSSFHEYLWNVNWYPILTQEQSQEGEKCGFFYA